MKVGQANAEFLFDLTRYQEGKMTKAELQAQWPKHQANGVRSDYAAAWAKMAGVK